MNSKKKGVKRKSVKPRQKGHAGGRRVTIGWPFAHKKKACNRR